MVGFVRFLFCHAFDGGEECHVERACLLADLADLFFLFVYILARVRVYCFWSRSRVF